MPFFQLYLTDLQTRESLLLCTGEDPILQLALRDDNIWVASDDSSVHRWPAEGHYKLNPLLPESPRCLHKPLLRCHMLPGTPLL